MVKMKTKPFIIISLTLLLLVGIVSAAWTYNPPVHYWKFDNNLTDTNNTNPLNFTFQGGGVPASYVSGKLNNAVNFTNSNYANMSYYHLAENITTITMWFKLNASSTSDQFLFALGDTATSWQPDSLYCGITTALKVYCAKYLATALKYEITGTSVLTYGVYYHFVLIQGGGGTQIYINQSLEGSNANTDLFPSDNIYLKIGRRYDVGYYLNGSIDNMAMFGYRFTSQQINDSYNNGSGVEYVAGATPPASVNLNLSMPQPYNETGFYSNPVSFNMSVNSSENFRCDLFINGGNMTASYYSITRYLWDKIFNASTTSDQNVDGGDWSNYSFLLDSLNTTFSTPKYSASNYGYLYLNFTDTGKYDNSEIEIKTGAGTSYVTLPVVCKINNSWSYIKVSDYASTNYWLNLSCLNNTGEFYNNFWNSNDPADDTISNFYSLYIVSRNTTHNASYGKGTNRFVEEKVYFPRYYEALINYSFVCSNDVDTVNTSNVTIMVDLVYPNIVTTFSSNVTFGFDWLKGQVNFTDPNLFGYNFSIDNVLWFNTSGISGSFYQLNISNNISNITSGYHNITMCVFDGHTDKEIGLFTNIKDEVKKELKYSFDNGYISIYPEIATDYNSFSTDKLKDRYTFTYVSNKKEKKDVVFFVNSSSYIYIPKKSDYKGHLIIPGLNKWVDFETENRNDAYIERINDNLVKITVVGVESDVIRFSSIGALNVLCRTYSFDRINVTDTSFSSFTEKTIGSFNLTINYSGTYTINVTLNYNNTNYQASTSDGHKYNVSVLIDASINYTDTSRAYYWNFTFNNSITQTNRTNSVNTTIYMMWLGTCGGLSNTTAFNFSFFDEVNTSLETTGKLNGLIRLFKTASYNRNYSIIINTERHDQLICMFPWYETYNVSGYLDYNNLTSTTKRYTVNGTISNVTRNVTLYLVANDSAIPVVLTVIDKDGFPIGAVQVKVDRYYPTTGVYLEVDSLSTDFQGQVRILMTLYTVEYRFRFEYPVGTLIDSTNKAYIISQTLTYQLIIGDEAFQRLTQSINVTGNLTWSNLSESFVFDYIDVSSQVLYGCLHVYKVSDKGKVGQNSSCLVATNGRINITFVPENNTQYDGEGFVCYSDRCDLLATASGYRLVVPSSFGKSGLLLVLLLTMVIACGVIFNASLTALLLPVPLCIGVFMGFVNLPPYVAIMIFLFGVTMAVIINLRSSP